MTKFLFLVPSLGCGGAERQLVALTNALGQRGYDVTIAVFYGGGVREQDVDRGKVKLVDLQKRSRWDVVGFLWRLHQALKESQATLLHGYLTAGNLAATAAAILHPGIRLFWGVRDSNIDLTQYGRLTRLTRTVAPFAARLAERVIVNSQAGVDHARSSGYPEHKLLLVPNGIDTSVFHPNTAEREAQRAQWGFSSAEVVIGLIGRIDPMKDHETFLHAAALVARRLPQARFVCVGDGDRALLAELRKVGQRLGLESLLLWSPALREMRPVYNALDILCSSSSYGEGFPNVIGEAMACETPCVATDIGDTRFLMGDTGRVVARRDPQALASALLEQCAAPHRNPLARKRMEECFSVEQLADRTEQAAGATPPRRTGPNYQEVKSCRTH